MSVVRLNFMPEFYIGDDAVLLTLDADGVDETRAALDEALRTGSSQRRFDGVTHQFHIEPGLRFRFYLLPNHRWCPHEGLKTIWLWRPLMRPAP